MQGAAAARPPEPPPVPDDPGGGRPSVRLCRDCRHVRPDYSFVAYTLGLSRKGWRRSAEYAACAHPSALREHTDQRAQDWIVSGLPSARPATSQAPCSIERSPGGDWHCGPDGQFWEPRRPNEPTGWRDPAARRVLLRAFLRAWSWFLASVAVGLGGGELLSRALLP